MICVKLERDVDAPADKVWGLLADFGNLDWFPGWEKVDVIGDGVGMMRRIHMAGMDPIEEILEAVDHDLKQLRYTIPRIPLPVTDYHAMVTVESLPGNRSHIVWECKAKPDGISDADAQKILEDTYGAMISQLEGAAKQ